MVGCKAVLLVGGFFNDDTLPASPSQRVFMQPPKRGHVKEKQSNKALEPIAGSLALEHVARALASAKRLQPLAESLFLVVNKCDMPLVFQGDAVGAGPLIPGLAALGLTPSNIISNDAQSAVEWLGELHDLQLAVKQIGSESPILAMYAPAFTVLPAYNLQRIVEHSFIRNRDVIATRKWCLSDAAVASCPPFPPQKSSSPSGTVHSSLEGDPTVFDSSSLHQTGCSLGATGSSLKAGAPVTVALAHAADRSVMPPLREIELGISPMLGDDIVEPIMLLKPATLAHISAASTPHTSLVECASQMLCSNQASLHSIDLGPGYVPLASCEYAHRWMLHFMDRCKPTEEAFLQQGLVEKLSTEFNNLYFGRDVLQPEGGVKRVPRLSDFKLPSTFYMTQYRRLAANALR